MSTDILARVEVSAPRRWIGIVMLGGLGALLLWLAAISGGGGPGLRLFLLGLGALAIWLADTMRRATALHLELTETELRDSSGTVLARVDQIVGIDRGAFALKPSHGFLLKLQTPQPRRWLPGLWWRMARRVGVGGVTPASQTKMMAETIQALIANRG